MQKWVSNITIILVLLFTIDLNAQQENSLLAKADSLYSSRKYTEAQQIYYQLFQSGYASSSTLVKMAFVYEGLNDVPRALFFLWQYYRLTEEDKVYEKIHILSDAHNLKGFELTDFDRIRIWISNRIIIINLILMMAGLLAIAAMYFFYSKRLDTLKAAFGIVAIFIFGLDIISLNLGHPPHRGVITNSTYLMEGPSPASDFLSIVEPGNQLSVNGVQDVWVKVDWNNKSGYVKQNDLLMY